MNARFFGFLAYIGFPLQSQLENPMSGKLPGGHMAVKEMKSTRNRTIQGCGLLFRNHMFRTVSHKNG